MLTTYQPDPSNLPKPGLCSNEATVRPHRQAHKEIGHRALDTAQPHFSVVRFSQRQSEILELRRIAYAEAGKLGRGKAKTDETDSRDAEALVVIAEVTGQLVASVRLALARPGLIFDQSCRFHGDLHSVPSGSDSVEASWGCIHPDLQGKGLFWLLAAHMLIEAAHLGRGYILSGTDVNLWSYWRRCGFRATGATYRYAHSDHRYQLIVLDIQAALAGRGIDPKFASVLVPLISSKLPDKTL